MEDLDAKIIRAARNGDLRLNHRDEVNLPGHDTRTVTAAVQRLGHAGRLVVDQDDILRPL